MEYLLKRVDWKKYQTFRIDDYCTEGKIESDEQFLLEGQNYNAERSIIFEKIPCENRQKVKISKQ